MTPESTPEGRRAQLPVLRSVGSVRSVGLSFPRLRDTLPPSKPRRGDAMKIPGLILKQMYTLGSLENVADGVQFSLKNRLSNATVPGLSEVRLDGKPERLDRRPPGMRG